MRLRILVATLNAAARVGCWLLETFAPSEPPEGAWHPAKGPECKPPPTPLPPATPIRPTERECQAIAALLNNRHTAEDWAVIENFVDLLMWQDELEGSGL